MSSNQYLQRKRKALQEQYDLLSEKLSKLRRASAITADVSAKFQLDEQIKQVEAELAEADQSLEAIAANLPAPAPPVQSTSAIPTLGWRRWLVPLGLGVTILTIPGVFLIYRQRTNQYAQLQTLLQQEDWKSADDETARIMWKTADRQQERSLRVEDFEKIPCSEIRAISDLWEEYSNKHFGFAEQKRIWLSNEVNSDFNEFILKVGWAFRRKEDGTIFYSLMDGQPFNLSAPAGRLPWAPTYYEGNSDTRISYMTRLVRCLP